MWKPTIDNFPKGGEGMFQRFVIGCPRQTTHKNFVLRAICGKGSLKEGRIAERALAEK